MATSLLLTTCRSRSVRCRFGFIGPNGAGKTTAMRIILGVLELNGGEVRWRGRLMDDEIRRRVGYIPEDHGQTFSPRCAYWVDFGLVVA
jgi:ABC-type uncharacterized transport system ATPase subunit